MFGGMQTSGITSMCCRCGKPTSRTIIINNKEISIHFTRKTIYWHITENGKTRKTIKKPNEWE